MTSNIIKAIPSTPENIEDLSPVADGKMLAAFSEHIQAAFKRRAQEIDYPVEAVL